MDSKPWFKDAFCTYESTAFEKLLLEPILMLVVELRNGSLPHIRNDNLRTTDPDFQNNTPF